MANEGSKLLMSLVYAGEKGFAEFLDHQFDESMFKGDEQDLYRMCKKHALSYGKLPDRKTLKKWCNEEGISFWSAEAISEPPKYYFDKMEHRNLKLGLLKAMKGAESHRQTNPEESLKVLTSEIIHLNNTKRRAHLINVSEQGFQIVDDEATKVKLGLDTGLSFGWPTLDAMSGGLKGGDLVSIVGRPGMGKTYMALHGMISAWLCGMTTLFVSMEMQATPVVQRVAAMHTKTSIGELKAGSVSTTKYAELENVMGGMKGKQGMWVADGRLSMSVEDILMLCQQLQPDVLYIDGAYLLRRNETYRLPRHERINCNTEDVKQFLAEGLNIPVTQTFQFNRGMTKKKEVEEVDLEDIAGSDAIGQLSSLVLGTFQADNIETKLQRKIRILKGRSGEQGEFSINWRFGGFGVKQDETDKDVSDVMNFSEIEQDKISSEMKFM